MRKHFLYLSMALSVLAACSKPSTDPTPEPEPELPKIEVKAELKSVTIHDITVDVTVKPGDTYFIGNYAADAAKPAEDIVADLQKKVEAGAAWADFLHAKSDSYTFSDLEEGTDYKVLVFGVRGDGSISSDTITIDATTDVYTLGLELAELTPFEARLNVESNDETIGWFAMSLSYDEALEDQDALTDEVMDWYNTYRMYGYEFEDLIEYGNQEIYGQCDPGVKMIFAVIAIGEDEKNIGDAVGVVITPPTDGINIISEKMSNGIYSAIYDYAAKSLGCVFEFTDEAPMGYVYNIMDFNNSAEADYGVGFYDLTDEEAEAAMLELMQEEFDFYREEYSEYFEGLNPDDAMYTAFYPVDEYQEFGRIWSPIEVEDLLDYTGEMPGKAFSAIGVFDVDKNYQIYPVEVVCVRGDYSNIDYSGVLASLSSTTGIRLSIPVRQAVKTPLAPEKKAQKLRVVGK